MEESTLRWPTDKERGEMEEVCSVRCRIPKRAVSDFETQRACKSMQGTNCDEWPILTRKSAWQIFEKLHGKRNRASKY